MVGVLSSRGNMAHISQISKSVTKSKDGEEKGEPVAPIVKARVSERLRIKKNRKEIASRNKLLAPESIQAVELSQVQVQFENPSHKMIFLAQLGLSPASGARILDPPYLQLDRINPEEILKQSKDLSDNESGIGTQSSDNEESFPVVDSDEDLDLEVVICPADIPEFFEEIYMKKPKLVLPDKIPTSAVSWRLRPSSLSGSSSEGFSDDKYSSPVTKKSSEPKLPRNYAKRKTQLKRCNSVQSYGLPNYSTSIAKIPKITYIDLTSDDEDDSLERIRERLLKLDTEVECVN